MQRRSLPSTWDELHRTASAVRAAKPIPGAIPPRRDRFRRAARPIGMTAALLTAAGLAVLHLGGAPSIASANGGYDSQLFSLTNRDRTSNGVHSLVFSGTLQNIAEGAPYNCNGIHVYGRSDDMIRRNYFAHPILGCGQLVFSMMQAFGVRYRSAGENIGWNAYDPNPAADINVSFMGSPPHKANILNPNYTEMGVGSDGSGSAWWTGQGREQSVWMFSEEFAQVGSSSPPPRRTPAPKPAARNSPAPPAPAVAPATTAPAPAAVTPLPTATPLVVPPGSLPVSLPAPPVAQYEGLFPNTIESVLEAFLNF